jgi:hypothetical protein
LGIPKASINTRETHKSDFVQVPQILHAQIPDIFRTDFSIVVIQDVGLDIDSQTLDVLLLDFSFPARRREASLNLGSTEILASPVPFAHLEQAFDPFIRRKASPAVIAKTTATNRTPLFDDPRIANSVIVVRTKGTSHTSLGEELKKVLFVILRYCCRV